MIISPTFIFYEHFINRLAQVEKIKEKILKNLRDQGFGLNNKCEILETNFNDKSRIRLLHNEFRNQKLFSEKKFIQNSFNNLEHFFANGKDVIPKKIKPTIHLVEAGTQYSELFRLASLLWSVPVSQGYGRRLRFVVIDEQNNKLIGIFALGDPVFNLKVRDELIGWDQEGRKKRLYNVMDIFVVGSVPPYSNLLCGKLVAMLASCKEVRSFVWNKYINQITTITKENKTPHLALLTTTSALGRSSIYNRLKLYEKGLFIKIGETSGWGHFHLANSTFDLMRQYLISIDHPILNANRFGQGPNWKIRTIRTCLELLGLPATMLNHGIKREVYICPLSTNYIEFLNGSNGTPQYYEFDTDTLYDFFKKRWLIPRSLRDPSFKEIKSENTLKELMEIARN